MTGRTADRTDPGAAAALYRRRYQDTTQTAFTKVRDNHRDEWLQLLDDYRTVLRLKDPDLHWRQLNRQAERHARRELLQNHKTEYATHRQAAKTARAHAERTTP